MRNQRNFSLEFKCRVVEELMSHGFLVSKARAGNPYENAMVESFFKTLKYEGVYNQKRWCAIILA